MRTVLAIVFGCAVAVGLPSAAAAELELVMVEEDGCIWCARWNEDVGVAYPKTAEGQRAPLRRIDIRAPIPDDLDLVSRPRLTPTFVLVDDGRELSRIEGYPGEDFFWPMLERMLTDVPASGPEQVETGADGGKDSDP